MQHFSLHKRLTLRYLLVLGTLAALSLTSFTAFLFYIRGMEKDGFLINVSGRQRMLSQRIALLKLLKQKETDPQKFQILESKFAESMRLIKNSHELLIKEGKTKKQYHDLYHGGGFPLDNEFRDYLNSFKDGKKVEQEVIDLVLNRLDDAVRVFEEENKSHTQFLIHFQVVTLIACLLVLLVSGLFIFRPMSEAIIRKTMELEGLNQTLEQRVLERTQALERKSIELLEEHAKTIQAHKMAALGEMSAGIAHEINNPLAVIKNLSSQIEEMVEEGSIETEVLAEISSSIVSSTDRVAKIIQGMRHLYRASGQDESKEVNVHKLIDETLNFCRERFATHGVNLIVQDFRRDLCFEGRETEVSQVLLNLLNNAFDAIEKQEKKWVMISVSEGNDEVEMAITDSGPGLSESVQRRLFEPFYTTKAIGKGTGLGLGISKRIVESHGGTIRLNTECKNTSFVFSLQKRKSIKGIRHAA